MTHTGSADLLPTSSEVVVLNGRMGRPDAGRVITHRFGLAEMEAAHCVVARPQETGALKMVLFRE
ncbi:MAG: hypothetical protein ABIQ18_24850 [Umezawaea sp.]